MEAERADEQRVQRRKVLQGKHAEEAEVGAVYENLRQTRTVRHCEHAASGSFGVVVLASYPERLQQRQIFQREALQLAEHVLRDEDASQRREAAQLQRVDAKVVALNPHLRHVSRRRLQLVDLRDVETRRSDDGSEVVAREGNVVAEIAGVYGEEEASDDFPPSARWFSRRRGRAA